MKIQTDNAYEIDFPHGLDARPEAELKCPDRQEAFAIPFVIRGEPGLLNVHFKIAKVGDEHLDYYHETFSSVLRPGGIWTNFVGRGKKELRGELTVPGRYFPIEVKEILVENLSARAVDRTL